MKLRVLKAFESYACKCNEHCTWKQNFCLKGIKIKFKIKCALTKQDTFKGWNELQVFARSKVMHLILDLGMSAIYLNYV